jgi:hypothetical protein
VVNELEFERLVSKTRQLRPDSPLFYRYENSNLGLVTILLSDMIGAMITLDCCATRPFFVLSFLLIVLSSLPRNATADSQYERDLKRLREFHREAIERAVEPVNKRYFQELETLLKRATFDGDLDTALLIQKEMQRIAPAQSGAAGFVGEWEYQENGKTYRRIILSDGKVELWRNGQNWKKDSDSYWWEGFTWRKAGKAIEIYSDGGNKFYVWRLEGNDTVEQEDLKSGKKTKMTRAPKAWRK